MGVFSRDCRGVAQHGSALLWGGRGRRFKSGRPDHTLLLALVLASGCGGSIGDFFQRVFVSPSTRVVRALGDRLKFDIADQTFDRAVTFLLADVLGLQGLAGLLVANAFDFQIDGQNPTKDLSLEAKYDPAKLPPGVQATELRLYRMDGETPVPVPGSTVDVAASTVSAMVRQEGRYIVAAQAP